MGAKMKDIFMKALLSEFGTEEKINLPQYSILFLNDKLNELKDNPCTNLSDYDAFNKEID